MSAHLTTAQIKSRLDHPVIDADGHWVEYGPVFTEQLRKAGGDQAVAGWSACKITRKEDWRDLFVTPFYFGCEADDPSNVWAFNARANPLGARLNAIFSSDIGHFDVPDMTGVLPEAYEMVEDELVTPADFRDFTFANVVRLFGTANPRFFEGTRVAGEAASVLRGASARAAAE